jgi:hypothetical protein
LVTLTSVIDARSDAASSSLKALNNGAERITDSSAALVTTALYCGDPQITKVGWRD